MPGVAVERVGARLILQHSTDKHIGIKAIPYADLSDGRRVEVGEGRLQAGLGMPLHSDAVGSEEGREPTTRDDPRKTLDDVLQAVRPHRDWYEALADALADYGVQSDEAELRSHEFVMEPDPELARVMSG